MSCSPICSSMWPTFASVEGFRKFHWAASPIYQPCRTTEIVPSCKRRKAAGELGARNGEFPKTRRRLGAGAVAPRLVPDRHVLDRPRPGRARSLFRRRTGWSRPGIAFYGSLAAALTRVQRLVCVPAVLDRAVLHLAYRGSVHAADLRAQCRRKRRRRIRHHPQHGSDPARVDLHSAAECRLPPRASLVPERAVVPIAGIAPGADGAGRLPSERRGQRSVLVSLGECVRAQQEANAARQPSSAFSSARKGLAG